MGKHAKRWTKKRIKADEAKAGKAKVYQGVHADKSVPAEVDYSILNEWARSAQRP